MQDNQETRTNFFKKTAKRQFEKRYKIKEYKNKIMTV
jgi:hypothetical protein